MVLGEMVLYSPSERLSCSLGPGWVLGHARSRAAAHTHRRPRGAGPGLTLEQLRAPRLSPEPHRPISEAEGGLQAEVQAGGVGRL